MQNFPFYNLNSMYLYIPTISSSIYMCPNKKLLCAKEAAVWKSDVVFIRVYVPTYPTASHRRPLLCQMKSLSDNKLNIFFFYSIIMFILFRGYFKRVFKFWWDGQRYKYIIVRILYQGRKGSDWCEDFAVELKNQNHPRQAKFRNFQIIFSLKITFHLVKNISLFVYR